MGERPSRSEKKQIIVFVVFMVAYAIFVLYFTVWSRQVQPHAPELKLFWSYRQWFAGDWELGKEIILNICLFVPVGFFAGGLCRDAKKRILITIVAGIILSALVEVMQYYFCRGLFEFDDVFNNLLGSILGGVAYTILSKRGIIKVRLIIIVGIMCIAGGMLNRKCLQRLIRISLKTVAGL